LLGGFFLCVDGSPEYPVCPEIPDSPAIPESPAFPVNPAIPQTRKFRNARTGRKNLNS